MIDQFDKNVRYMYNMKFLHCQQYTYFIIVCTVLPMDYNTY